MRVSIATASPVMRAICCRARGKRATRIEMKMMLSMPRTISNSESVMNATQVCGSASRAYIGNSCQACLTPLRQVVGRGFLHRGEYVLRGQTEIQRDRARDIDRGVRPGDDADDPASRADLYDRP